MRTRAPGNLLLAAAALAVVAGSPRRGEAATQVNGNTFVEDTATFSPARDSNLLQTGVNIDVVPPPKKKLSTNLNMRFNYIRSDEDESTSFSPLGNLNLDLNGEAFSLNLQHSRYATLGTTAQLTETALSRAAVSILAPDLPRLSASISRTETQTGSSPTATSDTGSVSADYQYRWLKARAGYAADRRDAGGASNESSSAFAGVEGVYQVLPATTLLAGLDLSRFSAHSDAGAESSTATRTMRLNADSRPLEWLGLLGNFARTTSAFETGGVGQPDATQQLAEATATVLPVTSLRLAATVGNRQFDDAQAFRSVDFRILSIAFSQPLRERILVGANASRSFESDPRQGENVSDNLGANVMAELTSRLALRLNASLSRVESRTFVSARTYDASGTLADRDQLDRDRGGLPAGFTFFEPGHGDLYTKRSSAIGDWTLTSHVDPVVGRFSSTRSLQLNALPTDRTTLTVSYSSNASAEDGAVMAEIGNQSLGASLTYLATRRSSLGLSGTAFFPERGGTSYSTTGSYAYRFIRGHQLNVSYARQVGPARRTSGLYTLVTSQERDSVSVNLVLTLRKRTSVELTYLATQLLRPERTDFIRGRLSHSF